MLDIYTTMCAIVNNIQAMVYPIVLLKVFLSLFLVILSLVRSMVQYFVGIVPHVACRESIHILYICSFPTCVCYHRLWSMPFGPLRSNALWTVNIEVQSMFQHWSPYLANCNHSNTTVSAVSIAIAYQYVDYGPHSLNVNPHCDTILIILHGGIIFPDCLPWYVDKVSIHSQTWK